MITGDDKLRAVARANALVEEAERRLDAYSYFDLVNMPYGHPARERLRMARHVRALTGRGCV